MIDNIHYDNHGRITSCIFNRRRISVGDVVSLTEGSGPVPDGRYDNEFGEIQYLLVDGGFKTVRDLRGLQYWNLADVDRVFTKK